MKKLLSLLSVLIISGTAIPNVIAVKPYELKQFDSILKKIKNWHLGELSNNLPETILNRIYKLNKNIKKNSIRIINVQQNTAKIIWDKENDNTENFVHVFFTVDYIENNDKLVGNSRFYNIPVNIDKPEISNPILHHSTNERQKQCRISVGKQASTSGIQNSNNKIERPKESPPSPPTIQIEEPIYATVLPKSQREQQNSCRIPTRSPRNLTSILKNTNLAELSDNWPETILQALVLNNPNINLDEINLSEITTNSARISANENSTRYLESVIVQFTLNNTENKISKEEKNQNQVLIQIIILLKKWLVNLVI